jgi:hypothetical protein
VGGGEEKKVLLRIKSRSNPFLLRFVMTDMEINLATPFPADSEFDFNHALDRVSLFVDSLMSFNVVIMSNDQPDIQVMELQYDSQLAILLQQELGEGYVQTIVNNNNDDTKVKCPFFRVCMTGPGNDAPVNFKLRSFLNRINMNTLNPRCLKAVVVGLATLHHMESAISVPSCFCTTMIDPIDLNLEEEIDMSCLESCAQHLYPVGSTLCDIAGLAMPCHLPPEIQTRILSYCSSPTADIIRDAVFRLRRRWDYALYTMFLQREPRIPVHIASIYNAATVQATAVAATRPFLVPAASGSGTASPRSMSL